MEASPPLTALIDQLLALFHRRSEDIPDGVFDRRTQFMLNGISFEERLGRSSSDPLALMLTRGAAGYRLTLKSILHAIPDARIERGEFTYREPDVLTWQCWLSGRLRGTGEPINAVFDVTFTLTPAGIVERAAVTLAESDVDRLRAARLRS